MMTLLHVCGIENKMSNGATVAVLSHIREQANLSVDKEIDIKVCHVRDEQLCWPDNVNVINYDAFKAELSNVDFVIFHEIYYLPFFKMAKECKKNRVPYVVIPHGGLTKGAQAQKKYLKRIINSLWTRPYINNAKAIQFLSNKEKDASVKWNDNEIVIPNGVSTIENAPEYRVSGDGMNLTFIGRLNMFYKGLDVLIETIRANKENLKQKNIHIEIYGPEDGDDAKEIRRRIINYDIGDVVILHGPVFGEEKLKALHKADLFIQPSRSEGMPMGILEAMAYGVPVIVSPGTGFAELVDRNRCGFVCETDAESIYKTILKAYDEKCNLRLLSKNAYETIKNQFSWDIVANKTLNKYIELIGENE